MKIRLVGVELFHSDRRTDITTLIVAFHNLTNPPKNVKEGKNIVSCIRNIPFTTPPPLISNQSTRYFMS